MSHYLLPFVHHVHGVLIKLFQFCVLCLFPCVVLRPSAYPNVVNITSEQYGMTHPTVQAVWKNLASNIVQTLTYSFQFFLSM